MDLGLDGRVAIVTGGSEGIGRATAARLAAEGARVALVARRHHSPFLGIRAVSDGKGDPLGLPGFPVQFAVYRQLAGNNAAAVTMALLARLP